VDGDKKPLLHFFQHGNNLLLAYGWKSLEKISYRVPSLQIVEKSLDGYTRSLENRGSAHNIGL